MTLPAISNGVAPVSFEKRPSDLDEVLRVANLFAASGFFKDATDIAKAGVKILAGRELGFSPFASITGISVIQGKPTIGAHLMAGAIVRAGFSYRVKAHDDTRCSIEFFKGDDLLGISTFTWAEAQKIGLTTKDNWKNYARNMLWARAMSNGARWYCAGAFGGAPVYTPDEMGAEVTESGEVKAEAIAPAESAADLNAAILAADSSKGGVRPAVKEPVQTVGAPLFDFREPVRGIE